jgi:uncharacterized membrane protein
MAQQSTAPSREPPIADRREPRRWAFVLPAVLLGVGLGGFFDGIVFHQVLQWHHMVSHQVPPESLEALQLNAMADGLFHAATWVITVAGVFLLWRAASITGSRPPRGLLLGGLLLGWGLFNLAEGTINHHLLELHHVREGPDAFAWDVAFLAWGAAMFVVGSLLVRRAMGMTRSPG